MGSEHVLGLGLDEVLLGEVEEFPVVDGVVVDPAGGAAVVLLLEGLLLEDALDVPGVGVVLGLCLEESLEVVDAGAEALLEPGLLVADPVLHGLEQSVLLLVVI